MKRINTPINLPIDSSKKSPRLPTLSFLKICPNTSNIMNNAKEAMSGPNQRASCPSLAPIFGKILMAGEKIDIKNIMSVCRIVI